MHQKIHREIKLIKNQIMKVPEENFSQGIHEQGPGEGRNLFLSPMLAVRRTVTNVDKHVGCFLLQHQSQHDVIQIH